eukprot:Nk52_evm29s123 gene=Nk52_evmTU29s123
MTQQNASEGKQLSQMGMEEDSVKLFTALPGVYTSDEDLSSVQLQRALPSASKTINSTVFSRTVTSESKQSMGPTEIPSKYVDDEPEVKQENHFAAPESTRVYEEDHSSDESADEGGASLFEVDVISDSEDDLGPEVHIQKRQPVSRANSNLSDSDIEKCDLDDLNFDEIKEKEKAIIQASSMKLRLRKDVSDLHVAASAGFMGPLQLAMVECGERVDPKDGDGRTPLMYAVTSGRTKAVKYLLTRGANPNMWENDGSTALHHAAIQGNLNIISLLLKENPNPNIRDVQGLLPVHWATKNSSEKPLQLLLRYTKKFNIKNGYLSQSRGFAMFPPALDFANKEMSDMTPKACIVNARDNNGLTPLMWAAFYKQPKAVKYLLEKGSDELASDIDGKSAVHWAIDPNTECLLLLYKGPAFEFKDNRGKTALHYAAEMGYLSCVNCILNENPSSIYDVDSDGRTPLHWAAACMKAEIMPPLINAGVPLTQKDAVGKTALDYSKLKNDESGITILRSFIRLQAEAPQVEDIDRPQNLKSPADDPFAKHYAFLDNGSYMSQYSNSGEGGLVRMYYWVDTCSHTLHCGAGPPSKELRKLSKKNTTIVEIYEGPRAVIRNRPDFVEAAHLYAFTISVKAKYQLDDGTDSEQLCHLDLIAENEHEYAVWTEALNHLLDDPSTKTEVSISAPRKVPVSHKAAASGGGHRTSDTQTFVKVATVPPTISSSRVEAYTAVGRTDQSFCSDPIGDLNEMIEDDGDDQKHFLTDSHSAEKGYPHQVLQFKPESSSPPSTSPVTITSIPVQATHQPDSSGGSSPTPVTETFAPGSEITTHYYDTVVPLDSLNLGEISSSESIA